MIGPTAPARHDAIVGARAFACGGVGFRGSEFIRISGLGFRLFGARVPRSTVRLRVPRMRCNLAQNKYHIDAVGHTACPLLPQASNPEP